MKTNQKSNSKKLNQLPLGNVPFFVSAITIQKFYVSVLKIELRCYIKAVSQKQIFREVKKHPEKNKTDKLISLFFFKIALWKKSHMILRAKAQTTIG